MPGLDDALERLVKDPDFRDRLRTDPTDALAGFDLTRDDLEVLANTVEADAGTSGSVEARQSKSALLGMMSQLGDAFDSAQPTGASGDQLPQGTRVHAGDTGEPNAVKSSGHVAKFFNPQESAVPKGEALPEGTYIEPGDAAPEAHKISPEPMTAAPRGDAVPEGFYADEVGDGDAPPEGLKMQGGGADPVAEEMPEGTRVHEASVEPVAEEMPEGTRVHEAGAEPVAPGDEPPEGVALPDMQPEAGESVAPGDETPEGLWVPDMQPDSGPESV